MKLYLITQDIYNSWDTYDGAVVCAESEEEARNTHITEYTPVATSWKCKYPEWSAPEDVKVLYLGEAAKGIEKGIVLVSFNAG